MKEPGIFYCGGGFLLTNKFSFLKFNKRCIFPVVKGKNVSIFICNTGDEQKVLKENGVI